MTRKEILAAAKLFEINHPEAAARIESACAVMHEKPMGANPFQCPPVFAAASEIQDEHEDYYEFVRRTHQNVAH